MQNIKVQGHGRLKTDLESN